MRLVVCFCVAIVAVGRVNAAEESDAIRELQARVEAMERQNRRLTRALYERRLLNEDELSSSGVIRQVDDNEWFTEDEGVEDSGPFGTSRSALISQPGEKSGRGGTSPWYEVGSDTSMKASWRNGLEIESANKDFRVHVGGRTQFDTGWYHADESVQLSLPSNSRFRNGVDFRRARLRVDGVMYETMEWVVEYDFVNSAGAGVGGVPITVTAPTDLWWQFNSVPVFQHFRVGNVKEPIGFEHLTSSRFLNFMERSFMQDAFFGGFNNGFTPGAQFFGNMAEERMTYNFGIFDITTNAFAANTGSSEYSLTGRLTALPYYENEGHEFLHVGATGKYWTLDEHQARFRTRASVRSSLSAQWPVIADTGLINADTDQQVNVELVGQWGPFSVFSEFLTSWLQDARKSDGTRVGPVVYRGGYVEALYFLTGEHRSYNRLTGVVDRVVPHENAFFVKGEDGNAVYGWGAWQLGARYQFLDLNSQGFNGGILHDTTLGINWFLNPNFKVQANYFFLYREWPKTPGTGSVQGFGIRLAHDF